MRTNDPKSLAMNLQQAINLATQHFGAGRLGQAQEICQRVLKEQPKNPQAWHLLGKIAMQRGELPKSVDLFRRAIAAKPSDPDFYNSLAIALLNEKKFDEAIAAFRKLLELKPDFAPAHNNLGVALNANGQTEQAAAEFRRALAIKPDYPEAHHNLGSVLAGMKQFEQAIEAYRNALQLKPNYPDAYTNLGNALMATKNIDEAISAHRRAIELKDDSPDAYYNLGAALMESGQMNAAINAYRRALELKPDYSGAYDNLIFALNFYPDQSNQMISQELRRWNQSVCEPLKKFIGPHANSRDPERRLKIGYVSADFCEHVSSFFLDPLLRHHDHNRFEIHCYAQLAKPDGLSERFESFADHWLRTNDLSDEQLAEQIRRDGIDILVDLKLHTNDNRLLVFARKPAPVQVTWLGYPGSTGLDTVDYRLTDPYLDPPGLDDQFYSEESIRLPDCFWCYSSLTIEPLVNELPALQNRVITFGCLNQFAKINDRVLESWGNILSAGANSRLLILAPMEWAKQYCLNQLGKQQITPERVLFVPRGTRSEYLQYYHQIDLALDPYPYNGHTTTFDSLWMGVPVVSRTGEMAVGRAGKSILSNIGLPELIANTPEEYVDIAVKLAGDLPRLAELRRTLRGRVEASPLMDGQRFARNVEAAYREMWRRWCAKT